MTGSDEEKQKSIDPDKEKLKGIVDLFISGGKIKNIEDYQNELIEMEKRGQYNSGFSDEERIMIVKAIDLKKGHWYKCRNGHVYAIGDCGGAMERSRCPECKEEIGGESHRLAEGNAHAGEFDGSRFPAWSDAANMNNYLLDNDL